MNTMSWLERRGARATLAGGRTRRAPAIRAGVALALAALGARAPVAAQESPVEPLRLSRREAVESAVARNPAVAAAREQVEQARARVVEAKALPDPGFATTLEAEDSFLRPATAASKDVGLSLTIPFPGKLRLSGRVAQADRRAAELSLAQLRQQIAAQTVQAYDAVLVAGLHAQNADEAKRLAQEFLHKTDARFQAGSVPKLDVVKAKVDLAEAENESIAVERLVATARAGLNRLIGRALGAPIEPTDRLDAPAPLPDLDTLIPLALASRPEILSNAAGREGAHDAATLARRYWLPDVSLTLSRNFTAGSPAAYSTAASFNLPLLFWQHEKGQVAETRHREAELAATASDLSAQVNLDVRTTYAAASTALRQAVYLRDELLPEAREAYRIASVTYGLGGSSALELLDAKRTMLDAENQYADALGSANDARADLERAVGAPLSPQPGGANGK